jgi:hypothetical protein
MTGVMIKPCPICKKQLAKKCPPKLYSAPAANLFGKADAYQPEHLTSRGGMNNAENRGGAYSFSHRHRGSYLVALGSFTLKIDMHRDGSAELIAIKWLASQLSERKHGGIEPPCCRQAWVA